MTDLKADDTGNAIVPVLACVLQQLCLRNDRLPMNNRGMTKFHALRPPAITIKDYLQRVAKYAACSGECFVLALVYIDRIIQSNQHFVVNSLNIHRLLITSIMLAAKFFDDQYFNNAYYAKVGGVPCHEINTLEVEFLFLCNFALFVNTDTYSQYYTELCNHATNTNNTCTCTQGPRVPQLVIPAYPQLSHPPPQLAGYVLYPHKPTPDVQPEHLDLEAEELALQQQQQQLLQQQEHQMIAHAQHAHHQHPQHPHNSATSHRNVYMVDGSQMSQQLEPMSMETPRHMQQAQAQAAQAQALYQQLAAAQAAQHYQHQQQQVHAQSAAYYHVDQPQARLQHLVHPHPAHPAM